MVRFLSGLRTRLLLLVLMASIPSLALMVYTGVEEQERSTETVKQDALNLARAITSNHEHLVESTDQLLTALAKFLKDRDCDANACSALFGELIHEHPLYENLAILDPVGKPLCSARPMDAPTSEEIDLWLQRAIERGHSEEGFGETSRGKGSPLLVLARPIYDEAGRVDKVLAASLNLQWFDESAASIHLPKMASLSIVDSNGLILARRPDRMVGETIADLSMFRRMVEQKEGAVEAVGRDGVRRLYAFMPLSSRWDTGRFVRIGIASEQAFAGVRRAMAFSITLFCVVVALVIAAAWFGSDALVLRRVRALVAATRKLAAGDLTARTGLGNGAGELAELAHSFDQMAEALERNHRERDAAARELERSHTLLEKVLSSLNEAVLVVDPRTRIIKDCNRTTEEMFGYSRADFIGRTTLFLYAEEKGFNCLGEESTKAYARRERYQGEILMRRQNGEIFSVEHLGSPIHDDEGRVENVVVVFRDVSERKKAEAALFQSERRFREMLENINLLAVMLDLNGNITFCNDFLLNLTGWQPEEIIGRSWLSLFIPPELTEAFTRRFTYAVQNGVVYPHYECEILTKSGERRLISWNNTILTDDNGFPIGGTSIGEDITESRRAEEALRFERNRLRNIMDSMWEGVVIVNPDHEIEYVNPALERLMGPVEGRSCHEYFCGGLAPCSFCKNERVFGGETLQWEMDMPKLDKTFERFETAITNVDGSVSKLNILHDVTDKKRLESQLRQAQKMEAIGTLAGGIAHDFNNILTPIIGYTEMVLDELPPEGTQHKDLEHVLGAAQRAKDLVRQILTFSRQTEQEKRPVRLSILIKEALKLLRASLPSTIEMRLLIAPGTEMGAIMGDPTQMHQVLMNLCTNAAHAMRGTPGRLTIEQSSVDVRPGDPTFPGLKGGQYLRLSVSDTGHGMDRAVMERIFEPFFTTKERGEGTGMGLAVVHGIVQSHEGAIYVRSEPEIGSTVDVLLPKVEEIASAERIERLTLPRGNERILLVDDESALVEMGKKMLENLGYTVVGRVSSLEALEAFRNDPSAFDLVLTDYTMPHMTGAEFAREVLTFRPDIPVVLCTGFSEMITASVASEIGITEFITKPVIRRDLAEAIRRALDAGKDRI